jgi:hypothetical protein
MLLKRIALLIVCLCFADQAWSQKPPGDRRHDSVQPVQQLVPMQQIMGDLQQLLNANYEGGNSSFGTPTLNLSETNYGVWGTDTGPCVALPTNDIFCLYGDTESVYWDPNTAGTDCGPAPANTGCWLNFKFTSTCDHLGNLTGGARACSGLKSMEFIPNVGGNVASPAGCSAIPSVDALLTSQGNAISPRQLPDFTTCWKPEFIINSSNNNTANACCSAGPSTEPLMASPAVSGLTSDADGNVDDVGPSHTPTGAFVAGGRLYVSWVVQKAFNSAIGSGYMTENDLLDCGPTTGVTAVLSAQLPCSKLYVWSQMPSYIHGNHATATRGQSAIVLSGGELVQSYAYAPPPGEGLIFLDETNDQEYRITGWTDTHHFDISPVFAGSTGTIRWSLMQQQQTNIGKFVNSTCEVYAASGLSTAVKNGLPIPLQSVPNVLVCWGSTWAFRQSNLYLLVQDASVISGSSCPGGTCYTYASDPSYSTCSAPCRENGTSGGLTQAYYLTGFDAAGNPMWTNDTSAGAEQLAVPLLTTINHNSSIPAKLCIPDACPGNLLDVGVNIGKPDVKWHSLLKRYLLTYGSSEVGGIQIRTSETPWGPWSNEVLLLANTTNLSQWGGKLISTSGNGFNFSTPNNAPVTCAGCLGGIATQQSYESTSPNTLVTPSSNPFLQNSGVVEFGVQYPSATDVDNGDGTVTVFGRMGLLNPYTVVDTTWAMTKPLPPFTLSSAPAALTIAAAGGGANATITITPAAGFSGTVSLTCSVAYNGQGSPNDPPTCSLNPAQLSVTSPNSANTTLSIGSTAPQMSLARPKPGSKRWVPFAGGGGFMVAFVLAGFRPRQRPSWRILRRRIGLAAFLMVVGLTLLMAPACGGGGGNNGPSNPGTTPGSYTVTVNASSDTFATSITAPLTVQ